MAYGEDCSAGVDAQRDVEGLRQDVRALERELEQAQREYREEVDDLRRAIRSVWSALSPLLPPA